MAHQPTPDTRKTVENGSGLGLPQEMIACLVGITAKTLRAKYKAELKMGKAKATVNVLQSHYKQCLAGNMTAIIWYEKTQLGWRETTVHEVKNPAGEAFETKQTYVPAGAELLQDYYAKLAQSAAAAPAGADPAASRDLGSAGPEGDEPGDGSGFSPR